MTNLAIEFISVFGLPPVAFASSRARRSASGALILRAMMSVRIENCPFIYAKCLGKGAFYAATHPCTAAASCRQRSGPPRTWREKAMRLSQ